MAGNGNNSAAKRREKALLDLVDKSVERMERHTDLEAPLTWLLKYYNDPKNPERERLAAAQSCLPYLHQKTPKKVETTTESTTTVNVTVKHQAALEQLDNLLDLRQLDTVNQKARDNEIIEGEVIEHE